MNILSIETIRQQLTTQTFGHPLIYQPKIGSTNVELKQLAQTGAREGLVYLAEEQTEGRGRLNRTWQAPPGSSLLMSVLFRPWPWVKPHQVQRLTMLSALALAEAIESCTGLTPCLKWPNDLMSVNGKKLAGVLTEFEIERDKINWVVVGLGLNVNVDFSQDEELASIATSLSMLLGQPIDRVAILRQFLENVEQRYTALKQGQIPQADWARRLMGLGENVTVTHLDGSKQMGLITGVDENGALLLQQSDGSVMTVLAGDVTLRE